jgi:hypothetical protein
MDSVLCHLWYLAQDTVVFAFFDRELDAMEKQQMADALLQVPRPRMVRLGKPGMQTHLMVSNPNLASFVGPNSGKLWELLGVGSDCYIYP